MFTESLNSVAQVRLESDPLRHLVTLKMLRLAGAAAQCRWREDASGWALLTVIPGPAIEWDRINYPDRDWIIFVDGTSEAAKRALWAEIPKGKLVVKTYDPGVKAHFGALPGTRRVQSFVSFTAPDNSNEWESDAGVEIGSAADPAVFQLFARNGYTDSELTFHFAEGARWFVVRRAGRPIAAGFVFKNFGSVWEIGGMFTVEEFRRQGLGLQIARAALRFLAERGHIPRYQVRSDNAPSIALARACGLKEFLLMDHLLVDTGVSFGC